MKDSFMHIAVASIAIRPMQIIRYSHQTDKSLSAEAVHNRNGGEPWKTKNKRGRR